jgi:hypothetical protein
LRSKKGGLSVLEFAVLATAIVTGLFLVHTYVRRAVERKWKDAADQIGMGLQYQEAEGGAPATVVVKH